MVWVQSISIGIIISMLGWENVAVMNVGGYSIFFMVLI